MASDRQQSAAEDDRAFDGLTRANLAEHVVGRIGKPTSRDARVKIIECDGRRAVIKDVRGARPWFRYTIGRWLIGREYRTYRRLEGVEGVPRALRMLDRDAFLVEYVDGTYLSKKKVRRGETPVSLEVYEACLRLIERVHERGVVHLDLRNRKNFVFDRALRPYVVDFASGLRLPAWLPFRMALVRFLGRFDRLGVMKMKRLLSPELVTEDERRLMSRFERLRTILFPPVLLIRALRRRRRRKHRVRKGKK